MGGPHVTACPEGALENGASVIVRHEGEEIIVPVVEAWESRDERALQEIPSTAGRKFLTHSRSFATSATGIYRSRIRKNSGEMVGSMICAHMY